MLLSFRTANHRSLRTEQQLLMTPQYADGSPEGADWSAVPVAGVFGANAAGKSNVVDALDYMRSMVVGSHRESEPEAGVHRHPFALDRAAHTCASEFIVDLMLDGVRHTYGFTMDDTRVHEEWLYSYPKHHKRVIYERTEDAYTYGDSSPAAFRKLEELVDVNVLFLSVASRSRQEILHPIYRWFSNNLRIRPNHMSLFNRPQPVDSEFLEPLTELLRAADTGIERLEVKKPDPEKIAALEEQYSDAPSEVMKALRRRLRRGELIFHHHGMPDSGTLTMSDQSRGTQALLNLAVPALKALHLGHTLVVDELDSSLHTYLSAKLIELFRELDTNRHGAQLIFTTHDAGLLGRVRGVEVLRRDHVWFVEKNDGGATELYSLSEFKPRSEENRERRYLAGRYGAVPQIDDDVFDVALAAREAASNDESAQE